MRLRWFPGGNLRRALLLVAVVGTVLALGSSVGSARVAATPPPVNHFSVTVSPASVSAGDSVTVTVTAKDASDAAVTDYVGTVTLTSSDSQAVLPAPYTYSPSDNGTHDFTVTLKTAGSQTVTASDGSTPNQTSGAINVGPGTQLGSFKWTMQPPALPAKATAGTSFGVEATAYDTFGNKKTDYSASATLTHTLASSAIGCSGPCAPSPASGSSIGFTGGVADFAVTAYETQTGQTLRIADGSVTADSGSFDVGPGPLGSFTWTTQPPTPAAAIAGKPFAVEVKAYDTFGNLKSDAGPATLTHALTSSSSGCSGPCSPSPASGSSITFAAGIADFDVTAYRTQAGQILTIADGSVTADSGSFDVGPGPLDHFAVAAPGTTRAGDPFAVTVTAFDAFGNLKTDYTGTAHFTTSDPGPSTVMPADYAFTTGVGADNGVHTFNGVILTKTPSQTITAADSSDASKNGTATIAVTPGPIDHFTVGVPSTTRAGDPFAATVTAFDAFGNVKTDYTGTAHFTTSDPGPSTVMPADYAFTTGVGADNGVHTFNGVILTKTPSQTITAADLSDASKKGVSPSITVTPGPLDHFLWGPQPSVSHVAGVSFPATVTAYDRFDNVKTDYNSTSNTVWSGLGQAPNAPHQQPTFGTFVSGVDSGPFTGYATTPQFQTTKINVTDSTSNPGTTATADSDPFSIAPNDPGSASFQVQPTETQVNVAIAPAPTVQVFDIFGNPEYGEPVTMTLLPPSGGASQFTNTSTTQVTTDSTGLATFTNLKVGVVALGYKMKAIASRNPTIGGGTASDTSKPFTIAQTVNPCNRQNCSGNANDPNNSSATVAGNVQTDTNTLGIALTLNAPPRPTGSTICPTFKDAPGADGSFINVNTASNGATKPKLTITWTISKGIMNKIPISPQNFNNGAAHYDICLGAAYIDPLTTPHGFPTKNGGTAVPVVDPITGVTFYWGLIPDCPKVPVNPCMLSRTKDPNGNPILKYFVNFPFDPTGWAGGGI